MQRNLDNFSFVENPFQKHQSYQQEAESTLKIWFCTNCGAQDKKIRRFPRALRKRTRNGRAEIGNELFGICDVMFGELVFMTIRDSEAFEKSSSFCFKVFWSLLTSRCVKAMKKLICGQEMSKYSRQSSNHWNQAYIWSK